ncbi:hypothetical protein [Rhodococcus koreensis]
MTFETMADDSDSAQARIFLAQLNAEIDIITARIETVEALTECARRARRLTERLRAVAAARRAVRRCTNASMRSCSGRSGPAGVTIRSGFSGDRLQDGAE